MIRPAARHFSAYSVAVLTTQSFLRRIKRMILKRIVVFRMVFYSTVVLTLGSFL